MKKLVFLFSLGFFILGFNQTATASHAAGGEITYKYIGDSTGIPYHYCITLTVYRRNSTSSAGLPASTTLNIASGCYSNISLNMSRVQPPPGSPGDAGDGGWNIPNYTPCINSNDPGLYQISQHIYKNCVILPGKCANYRFWWQLCCRNGNITNGPANANFYIQSTLNNTRGENTSPAFVNPAAKSFCSNTASPFVWSQNAVEPDFDSLRFTLQQPWSAQNTPIAWAPGYSTSQPMSTVSGFNLNAKNGTFFFQPSQPENVVLKIVVEEYRFDSTFAQYYLVGTAIRELQVPVVATCNPNATAGITIDSTVVDPVTGKPAGTALYPNDSLRSTFGVNVFGNDSALNGNGEYVMRLPVVPYACFDSIVTIEFDKGLVCDSFAANGSEFRIIGPDGVLRPVTSVNTNCQPDLLTRKVDLNLHKALDTVGDFLLYIKTGTDGNTLMNECGFPVSKYFAIIIRIDTCIYPVYDISNVTVNLDREIDINWEINPNTIEPSAFTAWNILRASMDDQYYILESLNQPGAVNLRSYKDTSLQPIDVDQSQYQYRVQAVISGKAYPTTRRIFSILLKDSVLPTDDGVNYNWTVYNGWQDGAYELQMGEYDTLTNQFNWGTLNGPSQNYFDQDYLYPDCEVNRDTSGLYVFRVFCTDFLNPGNSYVSESNWLYYQVECDQPPVTPEYYVKVPNIFTPNGDNNNDVFSLISAGYTDASVSVFNRWGKPVYEDSKPIDQLAWNGLDQNSGTLVADGVYYYIVKVSGDIPDGAGGLKHISKELTGSLTIFANGTK